MFVHNYLLISYVSHKEELKTPIVTIGVILHARINYSHRSSFGTQHYLGCRWINGLVPNHTLYGCLYYAQDFDDFDILLELCTQKWTILFFSKNSTILNLKVIFGSSLSEMIL